VSFISLAQRARNSAAYRSADLYREILLRMPRPRARERPALDLRLLTFGGDAHLLMIEQLATSLALAWPRLPRLTVLADDSLDPLVARARLDGWPGGLEVVPWRDLGDRLRHPHSQQLRSFAAREAMGRKLLAILVYARESALLYCDADVLWYRFPARLEQLQATPRPCLVMSADNRPAYDPELVPARLPELATPPYFCAGFLYARGDFFTAEGLGDVLEYAARRGRALTEQTLLAAVARRLGDSGWTAAEVSLEEGDRFTLAPSYRRRSWSARHYVGAVRHLFWRDALALRLGLRPRPA
jgi:hypothetical protein